ncbi:hypothetical protein [Pseudoroseomonas cervicalis]|uniref:hypothetical protein n=1 Tax=Teichococcus cervicalis TaxID=204525 RepID=UPI0022F1C5E9|nr:hypothetical protein [Pseudoroseomonas cervicalis]WBV41715.1 hypothetical protein PFY06_10750 [Pseudoroseomonas cervicalis]
MSGAALLAGGRAWRLPPGATPVEPPRPRPLPGAPATLPALALLDGQPVPVLAPGGVPGPVWLACQGASGRLLVTGEALLDSMPADALPLPLALEAPAGAAPSAPPAPPGPLPPLSGRARRPVRAAAAFLALGLGEGRLVVPLSLLRRVVAFPELVPAPGRPAGALGLGLAEGLGGEGAAGMPVLVLDPLWLDPGLPPWPAPPLLAVLALQDRLYALPCDRAAPQAEAPDGAGLEARLAGPAAAPLRALAPPLREPPPPPPEPRLPLLLARAGDLLFALPAEEVAAVVPPQRPRRCRRPGCAASCRIAATCCRCWMPGWRWAPARCWPRMPRRRCCGSPAARRWRWPSAPYPGCAICPAPAWRRCRGMAPWPRCCPSRAAPCRSAAPPPWRARRCSPRRWPPARDPGPGGGR